MRRTKENKNFMSYTKGEWNVWENKIFNIIEISCPEKIAEIPYINDVSKANAKLIAAAPNLLEALETLRTAIFYAAENHANYLIDNEDIKLIEAAISKAVGV